MKLNLDNFEKIYEELVGKDEEKVNLIGVCTLGHPHNPFMHFIRIPNNKVTGTSKDWEVAIARFKEECSPRGTQEMVYYLDVPAEIASKLLRGDFYPEGIRKEITMYMWGKIGRLIEDPENWYRPTFVPGSASKGPIRRGKSYPGNRK